MSNVAKLIAFYLPQFHPTPYNDEWWGKGFTEWTNVAKARPRFRDHYQPHLPADLGFYDLRLPETREAQADLASEYGIYGFCYYHYWFGGKRLLERPFHEVLDSGKPDFPFCLCWANENWTRVWDGSEKQILMPQSYSHEDDLNHIRWLARSFSDPRYIRLDGKPMFAVYRSAGLPDPKRTTDTWREEAQKLGIGELYLCLIENNFGDPLIDPGVHGFDAAIEFQPKLRTLRESLFHRGLERLNLHHDAYRLHSYMEIVDKSLSEPVPSYARYSCVCPSWDNTPRHPTWGLVLRDSTPEKYGDWLREVIDRTPERANGERIVFVNAWNEWAEGCHLEPCQKWGRSYLESTKQVLYEKAMDKKG